MVYLCKVKILMGESSTNINFFVEAHVPDDAWEYADTYSSELFNDATPVEDTKHAWESDFGAIYIALISVDPIDNVIVSGADGGLYQYALEFVKQSDLRRELIGTLLP